MFHIYHMTSKTCKGCREIRRVVVKSGRAGSDFPANGFPKAGRVPEVSSAAKSHTCKISPVFSLHKTDS
jgi:hypothetical protein